MTHFTSHAAAPGRSQVTGGDAAEQLSRTTAAHQSQHFQPLPPPTGPTPYRLSLADVLGPAEAKAQARARSTAFHVIGDSGGVKFPVPQQLVADRMVRDLDAPGTTPAFCYHVGDVVYFNGQSSEYYAQFFAPYEHYRPPLVGIPGNHDADPLDPAGESSLAAFVRMFCSIAPQVPQEAGDAPRTTMIQPNVYWTLEAPHFTLVGLYTNVPSNGEVDATQVGWFVGELEAAPRDRPLLVALHHPPFSADAHHGGSARMAKLLDDACASADRLPDLVLSGHVHNYQRFTRTTRDRAIPYLVVGASGYWHLHNMARAPDGGDLTAPWDVPGTDVQLEAFADDRHGFLRLEVSKRKVNGFYTTVPRPHESWSSGPTAVVDRFELDTATHVVKTV